MASKKDKQTQITQVCVEPRPPALNMTLPAFAVSAGACSRYRSIAGNAVPAATRDRANLPQMHPAAAVDRRDRRTDIRTPTWTVA